MVKIDWQQILVKRLLAAGTTGLSRTTITKSLENLATAAEVTNELEAMHSEDKVQRFELPSKSGKGAKATWWRATTELLKGWP